MDNLLFAVVALCWRWLQPRHNVQVQFLQAQIRVLRARVKSERILLSPEERAELLRLGGEMDHQVGELLHVVKPDTYRRWRRERCINPPLLPDKREARSKSPFFKGDLGGCRAWQGITPEGDTSPCPASRTIPLGGGGGPPSSWSPYGGGPAQPGGRLPL